MDGIRHAQRWRVAPWTVGSAEGDAGRRFTSLAVFNPERSGFLQGKSPSRIVVFSQGSGMRCASPPWPIHARARPSAALRGSACTRRSLLPRAHWRAAGSSRSSTPDALAPQARPDPPPRTRLRRRLVSILHAGGERARRGLLPSARTAGCVVAFVIAELRAPSRSSTAGGATPHASQSCSREPPPPPLACPPRAAPLSASRPRPRCARSPTPAPRPRQIGSCGRRRGCSSARTSPPTGLEHGREQAQGPRSCTHERGERPRTWPRDSVSVFCHVLSCLLNTCMCACVHVSSFPLRRNGAR